MPHNKRSPQQWQILSEHTDFQGKSILDAGCGHADLLAFAKQAGAGRCLGIDSDYGIIADNSLKHDDTEFWQADIEVLLNMVSKRGVRNSSRFDYFFCFSVLPYLEDPVEMLENLRKICREGFLEVQYKGDGPGVIEDDDELLELVHSAGWSDAVAIGSTRVDYRNVDRVIWHVS